MTDIPCRKLTPDAIVPKKAHDSDAAFDLYAAEPAVIASSSTRLIKTGIAIQLPSDVLALILSRSGLALKSSVFVLNSPGLIDPGYRGEIGVVLYNASASEFPVAKHDRIAQILFQKMDSFTLRSAFELISSTDRGEEGFGSTGVNTTNCRHVNIVQDDEGNFLCTKCGQEVGPLDLDHLL